jgi:hypothetical protein
MTNYQRRMKKRLAAAKRYLSRKANERVAHERKSDDIREVIKGTMTHAEFNAKHSHHA